jgi:aldose 1-epimerase
MKAKVQKMSETAPTILSAGRLRLELRPGIGGSISRFAWSNDGMEWPVFRGAEPGQTFILEMGSFPLVPWVNRVRGGGFGFRGRHVELSPELRIDPSPLHGHGWLAPWQVQSAEQAQATLAFRHEAGEWPWTYSARQDFTLDDEGLSISLSCTNESDTAMPCGLGHHPYFPCGPETRLDTKVDCTWTIDELVLPVEKVAAEGRFSMSDRSVCAQSLDHGFGGWGGWTRISDPNWPFRVEFSSPTARFFQLYSPPEGGFFVAEPVTHANTAMNAPEEDWPELGMEVLEPGETMVLETRFEVTAL